MQQGSMVQFDQPVWEPLETLVGDAIADGFMWMNEIELEDGSRVHSYKNIATRRYLHLGLDGQAYRYRSHGNYTRIDVRTALEDVFDGWEELLPAPSDPDAMRALLARYGATESTSAEPK